MRFERYVATRYLRGAQGREEGQGFLRFITVAAIGGVAIGVAALLLALSVVRGFSREIQARIVGFGAHVQVERFQDAPLEGAAALRQELAALDGVADVAPVVQEFALLRRSATDIDGVAIWGTEVLPPYLASHLAVGIGTFQPDAQGRPGLVIGQQLATRLGVSVGDRVTAFSLRNASAQNPTPHPPTPRIRQFHVAGLYETSLADFDELYVFTDVDVARRLLDYGPDEVTRFDLTLHDLALADSTVARIEARWGFPLMARTVFEVFSSLFAWVDLQESIIPVVIGGIILVAAFNIVGTLLMMILEKTREMGILLSMGASARALERLFLWVGMLIGGIGLFLGEGLALSLAWVQQRYGIIPLPAEAYYMKTAPIALHPLDFLLVALVTLALCRAAAYIPARLAARRLDPIQAIRFR
jgi:lipoprotein-releasing system permease protein